MSARSCRLAIALSILAATIAAAEDAAPAGAAPGGAIPFSFDLDLAYEYRLGPAGAFLVERTPVKSGIDLMRDFFDREPLARLALAYGGPSGFSVAFEATLRAEWDKAGGNYGKADNLPVIGAEGDPLKIENYFITRGVAAWRGGDTYASLGRDRPDFGGILYGSLLPGRRLPYLDALRAGTRLGRFGVDCMVATIQAVESWDGRDVDPNAPSTSWTAATSVPPKDFYGFETDVNPTTVVEALTRLHWELGDFEVGVADHAMMARRNNRFYLTDFLPIGSRHQTSVAQTNNSMVLDASWRPLAGLTVAAQAGCDDFSSASFGIADTGSPTIDAYVLGAEYRGELGPGPATASVELGYTHYLWGNYDGSEVEPCDQNPLMRFQYRFLMDSGAALLPLTSPYGPGALWLGARCGLELPVGFGLGAELLLFSKNEEANLIETPVLNDTTTASGSRFFYASLSVPLTWERRPWELGLTPALLVRDGEWRGEVGFLAKYALRIRTGGALR